MMVCLIFHTEIIINRKNCRIAIKIHLKSLSIFFKKCERTPMLGPPSSLFVCAPFLVTPSLSPQRTYFLNDPLGIRRSYNCILSF